MNSKCKQKKNQVLNLNLFEKQELINKVEELKHEISASIWHELETRGKFTKDDKISFISDDMLIVGCDIGSEVHYIM